MGYNLCLKTIDGKYKKLDITLSSSFKRFSRFKDKELYSLEDIDKFTSQFYSEYNLKGELFKSNIITFDDILGEFAIFKKSEKHGDRQLQYGVVYGIEYSDFDNFSPEKIKNFILSKASANYYDEAFLKQLIDKYWNDKFSGEYIREIKEAMNRNPEVNLHISLENFVHSKLYGIWNSDEIIYSSARDLVMFCIDYNRKVYEEAMREIYPNVTDEDLNRNRIECLRKLQNHLCPENNMPSQDEHKPKSLQMTFF